MDPPGSLGHGFLQARILGVGFHALLQEIFSTQGLNPCLWHLPALAGRFFTSSATWEAPRSSIALQRHARTGWKSEAELAACPEIAILKWLSRGIYKNTLLGFHHFLVASGQTRKIFLPLQLWWVSHTQWRRLILLYTLETLRASYLRDVEILPLPSDPWVQY